jgi:hypothetical protein
MSNNRQDIYKGKAINFCHFWRLNLLWLMRKTRRRTFFRKLGVEHFFSRKFDIRAQLHFANCWRWSTVSFCILGKCAKINPIMRKENFS